MKFRIGEKVKFLNEIGEGEIVSVINKKTVLVRTADGFEVPVLESELVSAGNDFMNKKEDELKVTAQDRIALDEDEDEDESVYDYRQDESYVPEDDEIVFALNLSPRKSDIFSFLVNSSTYHLYYVISLVKEGEDMHFSSGRLEPDTKVQTGKIIPDKLGEEMSINISLLFFGKDFYTHIRPVDLKLKINPADIYSGKIMAENDYFEEDAAVFPIYSFRKKKEEQFENVSFSGDLADLAKLKEINEPSAKAKKAQRHPEIEEVDLHIESIVDDYKGLTSGEIVDIQMGRFKTALEGAIIHKTRRIVFIHGIGAGKLKHEIRRTLDRQYPDLKYQDASFQEYGYGATMVIIPQR